MKKIVLTTYLLALLAVPASALAISNLVPPNPNPGGIPGTQTSSAAGLFNTIILVLLGLAGIIAVLFIIVGGFQYMTSGGNEELAERGKRTLVNGIIGLVIIILSYVIVTVITNTVFNITG